MGRNYIIVHAFLFIRKWFFDSQPLTIENPYPSTRRITTFLMKKTCIFGTSSSCKKRVSLQNNLICMLQHTKHFFISYSIFLTSCCALIFENLRLSRTEMESHSNWNVLHAFWFHLKKPLRNILTYKSSKS